MQTYIYLLLSLLVASNLIIQTQLHGAASSGANIIEQLLQSHTPLSTKEKSRITSAQLINLYTGLFLHEPGAADKLKALTQALLTDETGSVILSVYNNFDTMDIEKFTRQYLPNGAILTLPSPMLAELIYIVRHVATQDTPEILSIKKLLYTAVQYNLLNNPTYTLFKNDQLYKEALNTITDALVMINTHLGQDTLASDDQPAAMPVKKSKWYDWIKRRK